MVASWCRAAFLSLSLRHLEASDPNDDYFRVYAHPDIHRQMLQDRPRTEAYGKALLADPAIVKGKTVLDFGCGTGILSMFAAKAGAKRVFCIEASSMAEITKENIAKNGFEKVVTVMRTTHDKLKLPGKVDVIISEWMGFLLVLEDMLDDLLQVRDKWLKPGGKLWPRFAQLWMQPFQDNEWWSENIGYWDSNPYGFDLSPMSSYAFENNQDWPWPIRGSWRPSGLQGEPHMISNWDLESMPLPKNFKLASKFSFPLRTVAHGMLIWFDCVFDHPTGNITLTTHPKVGAQHWGQIFWPMKNAPLTPNNGEEYTIEGIVRMRRNPPAWGLSMAWRAPPLVTKTITTDAGDLHVETFTTEDDWTRNRALKMFLKEDGVPMVGAVTSAVPGKAEL